jgi:hypothetical protein
LTEKIVATMAEMLRDGRVPIMLVAHPDMIAALISTNYGMKSPVSFDEGFIFTAFGTMCIYESARLEMTQIYILDGADGSARDFNPYTDLVTVNDKLEDSMSEDVD